MVEGAPKTEASLKDVPLDAQTAECLWAWKGRSPYPAPGDWVFASPHMKGQAALLAWNAVALLREAGTEKSRNRQTRFVSHFPTHVWDFIECEWRESEGCAGVAPPREPESHDGRLHAGSRASEARGAKQFGQVSEKRFRFGTQIQLSGSNWI